MTRGRLTYPFPFKQSATPNASAAVRAGGWVFVSGQLPRTDAAGMVVDPEAPFVGCPPEVQSASAYGRVGEVLALAGCDMKTDCVRIYQWLVHERPTFEEFAAGGPWPHYPDVMGVHRSRDPLLDPPRPASTGIGVRGLMDPRAEFACDVIAMSPQGAPPAETFDAPDSVEPIFDRRQPGEAPKIAGLRRGDWIFLTFVPTDWAGDFGSDRSYGEHGLVAPAARTNPYEWFGTEIEAQTEYTLNGLAAMAEAAGSSLGRCVKAEVYIGHPSDYAGMDRVWRSWFQDNPPARVVVPYSALGGKGWRIEISMQFLANDAPIAIETIETSDAPEPFGHEPQAVRAGELLFLSTQLPADSAGRLAASARPRTPSPYVDADGRRQMELLLGNAAAICQAGGTSIDQLCRCQTFYDDFAHFHAAQPAWLAHVGDPPTRTDLMLGPGWPLIVRGARLLLDLIAYVPNNTVGDR